MKIENVEISRLRVDIEAMPEQPGPCLSCFRESAELIARVRRGETASLNSVLGAKCAEKFLKDFAAL